MTRAALVLHQFRYDRRVFWRNPISVGFTVMFPVIFLVSVGVIVKGQTIHAAGGIGATTYIVAAAICVAIVSATAINLAMSLTILREAGILKRLRGTPLPSWAFVAGRIGNAIVIALLMLVLVTAVGRSLFAVPVPWSHLPALVISLIVGSASFCALGIALTAIIPSREAAPAITNLIALPLYVLSFIPASEIPKGVLHVADSLPVRPLFDALLTGFDPATSGAGFEPGDLAVVAAWGLAGLLLAMRHFRWEPRV
ncbi:MAG TPA: ABC transporter permease [Solirubrobacterales bacterium]|jgi:ABC-2 type transport system permease protein|nr:ABC transporter permease [Solirubrobacterales bacterium]